MATIEKSTWVLNNKCRFVDWTHPNEGWDAFKEVLDLFISAAIDDIVSEYQAENVEWLEITTDGPVVGQDGDLSLVEVMPTQDGPFGDGDTRLTYRLFTNLLEDEKHPDPTSDYDYDQDPIGVRFWDTVEECLTSERSYIALMKARMIHRMRLAAYAYDASEGLHYLPKLVDPEFNKQYRHYLENRGW